MNETNNDYIYYKEEEPERLLDSEYYDMGFMDGFDAGQAHEHRMYQLDIDQIYREGYIKGLQKSKKQQEEESKETYNKGLETAYNIIKQAMNMSRAVLKDCFGVNDCKTLVNDYSIKNIIRKSELYASKDQDGDNPVVTCECGATITLNSGWEFCPVCGKKFSEEEPVDEKSDSSAKSFFTGFPSSKSADNTETNEEYDYDDDNEYEDDEDYE